MKITAKTSVLGIIGHPVEHSLSPEIHNACFAALNLPFVYVAFNVTDVENAVQGIRALGIRGVSVTIPHKISVIKYLDKIEGIAKKIGAINTIINEKNRLIGYNTDATGIASAFREAKVELRGKRCLILGSGGAARAAAFVLCESEPASLEILSIEKDQLEVLINDLKKYYNLKISGVEWTENTVKKSMDSADVIINATPLGMWPETNVSPVNPELLRKEQVVFDVIYTPPETLLLRSAKDKGCKTIGGVEMFVHQAAEQFQLFTGVNPPVDLIRKTLAENIKK